MADTAQAPVIDDVEFIVPETGDFETMPAGAYPAKLIGFQIVDKPEWKLTGADGEDKQQWKWTYEVTDPEWEGKKLDNFTSRSLHPMSNGHKHAAALLGVPELHTGMGSTKMLIGRACQLIVIEKANTKGEARNYINSILPAPKPRHREAKPRIALPGGPPASSFAPGDEVDWETA